MKSPVDLNDYEYQVKEVNGGLAAWVVVDSKGNDVTSITFDKDSAEEDAMHLNAMLYY